MSKSAIFTNGYCHLIVALLKAFPRSFPSLPVYEKYPITGITQSYRHTRETPTVVMPVLIVSLIAAMAVFFVKSKPQETVEPHEIVSTDEETPGSPSESSPAIKDLESSSGVQEAESAMEEELSSEEDSVPDINTVSAPAETSGEFTAWMTPLALDTYIRLKNRGYSESFWQRGHWITAVEGRWENGSQEFRIALDKVPDLNRWQWQYRVNQTTEEFANASRDFADRGFELVHTQTFTEPGGKSRFQAVWQREVSAAAPVVETSITTAPTTDSPQALDVNNLRFR